MGFFTAIREWFEDLIESIFSSSSPEYKKKHQLRQLQASLKAIDPPIFRADGFLLPAFPATLYQINLFLKPVRDVLNETIASTDRRVGDRYRDYLLELAFTDEQRAMRKSFLFTERGKSLIAQPLSSERVIEDQGKKFAQFLKTLDLPPMQQASKILQRLDRVADFCQFDFNGFFSAFDPAFKAHIGQETTVESPSFKQIEVGEVVPALLDLYYLLSGIDLSPSTIDLIIVLETKKNEAPTIDEASARIQKIFQAVLWLMQKRLSKEALLAIIRVAKNDPEFVPQHPDAYMDYLAEYKNRITEFFHSDSRKLLKDKQDGEIQTMITGTFGQRQLETLAGYNDQTNDILQEFTTLSLEWIKPLQIIKTFSKVFFAPHFRQMLQSTIVEGYFNNRTLQSSLATSYYYCESIPAKMAEFESLFGDNQPCSVKIITGYLTELEKGIDFEKPLRKMVDNMNALAKSFVQQAVNQFAEAYHFTTIIIEDNKKTVPDFITNVRTLSMSSKNQESYAWLEKEIGVFRNFLEIMKKYAIVGTLSVPVSLAEQTES